MSLWHRITSLFRGSPGSSLETRLSARNKADLSASIERLDPGSRGWITRNKAGSFFSAMGNEFAFGEMDDKGRAKLASFSAQDRHRSESTFVPAEGRVYFKKLAGAAAL